MNRSIRACFSAVALAACGGSFGGDDPRATSPSDPVDAGVDGGAPMPIPEPESSPTEVPASDPLGTATGPSGSPAPSSTVPISPVIPDTPLRPRDSASMECDAVPATSGCGGDADCADDEVCLCGVDQPNRCVLAQCRASSECQEGGDCVVTPAQTGDDCSSGAEEYRCQSAEDECLNHSGCGPGGVCRFYRDLGKRVCIGVEDLCIVQG